MAERVARLQRRLVKLTRILRDGGRFRGTLWCLRHSRAFPEWARDVDPALWAETLEVAERIHRDAARVIPGLPITGGQAGATGGGGCDVRKLYFLARRLKPHVIVETGVSAGYSSRAFLEAIHANGFGRLYSSDLPIYLTREQVGCMVPHSLREPWTLYYDGDAVNLQRIFSEAPEIDLFHYDSDKAMAAKEQVFAAVRPRLRSRGVVVVDDIDRDVFFQRLAGSWSRDYLVFRTVGVLGLSERAPSGN